MHFLVFELIVSVMWNCRQVDSPDDIVGVDC